MSTCKYNGEREKGKGRMREIKKDRERKRKRTVLDSFTPTRGALARTFTLAVGRGGRGGSGASALAIAINREPYVYRSGNQTRSCGRQLPRRIAREQLPGS
jgi:hypothetical protein